MDAQGQAAREGQGGGKNSAQLALGPAAGRRARKIPQKTRADWRR